MESVYELTGNSDEVTALVLDHGLNLIGAVVILIIGYILMIWTKRLS